MAIFLVGAASLANRQSRCLIHFRRLYPSLGRATRFLVITIIPAAVLSIIYGPGSWQFTLLGIAAYATPLLAVVIGFYLPRNGQEIRKLLSFYCVVTAVMISGAFVEYYGLWPGSPIIGTEALDMTWLRYSDDFTVQLIAGFYRSPDVMGWHAAAVVMLALVLASTSRGTTRITWLILAGYAVFPLMLSGRRKMFYMLPVFIAALTWILWNFRRSGRKNISALVLVLALSGYIAASEWLGQDSTYVRYYSKDAASQTAEQFQSHAAESLVETYKQSGFFGFGLGFASPGSHHIAGARPPVWQESGPSRILAEIGVPGFIAMLGLLGTLILVVWREIQANVTRPQYMNEYAAGLLAFILANLGSLSVSGQILADSFISIFISLAIGLTLWALRFSTQSTITFGCYNDFPAHRRL